jgi:hypothetical protein
MGLYASDNFYNIVLTEELMLGCLRIEVKYGMYWDYVPYNFGFDTDRLL